MPDGTTWCEKHKAYDICLPQSYEDEKRRKLRPAAEQLVEHVRPILEAKNQKSYEDELDRMVNPFLHEYKMPTLVPEGHYTISKEHVKHLKTRIAQQKREARIDELKRIAWHPDIPDDAKDSIWLVYGRKRLNELQSSSGEGE